jgi:MYXO-CTERM domain-containing protein
VVVSNVKVVEGNAGLTSFEASVSLSPYGPQGVYQVDITALPGTASESDYVFTPFRLTVSSGGAAQLVKGFVVGDAAFEGDEQFTLHAAAAPGGYVGSQGGIVTIVDDDGDAATRVRIAPSTSVPEGNAGWHWIEVDAHLSSPATNVVSFDFALTGGQPAYEAGNRVFGDYRQASGTITFAPGETHAPIPVEIYGDTEWERDSSFQVQLSNVRGALLDGGLGTVVLTNDDVGTKVWADDVTVVEGNAGTTQALVRFRFDPPISGNTKVALTIEGGSALAGEDFVSARTETLYPPYGATEVTYALEIRGDTSPESDEDINVRYQLLYLGDDSIREVHVTILDDDGPQPDAGAPRPDTGTPPPDTGTPPANPDLDSRLPARTGCACSSAPSPGSGASATSALATLALLAAALFARRRSTPTPARSASRRSSGCRSPSPARP